MDGKRWHRKLRGEELLADKCERGNAAAGMEPKAPHSAWGRPEEEREQGMEMARHFIAPDGLHENLNTI